jgi:serine/threonine-protein kinase HipA
MAKGSISAARVILWGKEIGAVAWDADREIANFEYTSSFLKDGFDVSPIAMPRRIGIFSFPTLGKETFHGLPGLLADSIPDKFGNALIDAWLARQGRANNAFSPVERLCYIGSRGMGALEFQPALRTTDKKAVPIEIAELVRLAQHVLDKRIDLIVNLKNNEDALDTILRVGTSAGGARAKALISWNRKTNEIRSGQVPPPKGFESWILKFDGVNDKALGLSQGYGRIEYAYHKMARDAGITMSECHLFEEHTRAHFMTRRFDRKPNGDKIHVQSLCGIAHYDFNMAGAYAYEQAFAVIQKLNLGYDTLEEMYRRMVFNIVARNQDDHTKNIDFLMDNDGTWRLSPAFDVIWAYSASGPWTHQHQMTVNGKRDNFTRADLLDPARQFGIKNAKAVIEQVCDAVSKWPMVAKEVGATEATITRIAETHRLHLR